MGSMICASRPVLAVAATLIREEGWRRLYKGFGAAGVRAFVVNSVIFSVRSLTVVLCAILHHIGSLTPPH
jgi:hypothetical protein